MEADFAKANCPECNELVPMRYMAYHGCELIKQLADQAAQIKEQSALIEELVGALEFVASINRKTILEMDMATGAVTVSEEIKNRCNFFIDKAKARERMP
jgi:hypothetical protein